MMASAIAVVSCNTEKKEPGNPFFAEWNTPFGVPPFDQIENEHYLPAIDSGIAVARISIAEITGNQEAPTFANTVAKLDRADELLSKVAAVFYSQTSANTNDTPRDTPDGDCSEGISLQ